MTLPTTGYEIEFDISTDAFFAVLTGALALMVAAALAMLTVQLARTWQPPHRMRAIDELSRRTNLEIPEDLRAPLAGAVAARQRGSVVGSMIGLSSVVTVMAVLWRPWEAQPPAVSLSVVILGSAIAGSLSTLGAVAGGLLARRSVPGTPRSARLTSLEFPDLVAPIERRIAACCVAGGVGVPAVLIIASRAPWADTNAIHELGAALLLGGGLLAATLWLALPRISRRLSTARVLTGDEHALAWSDQLAARTVRDVVHLAANVSGTAAIIATMGLGLALPRAWGNAVVASANVAVMLALVGAVVAVVMVGARQPERHVQRTLWPQFAADAQ